MELGSPELRQVASFASREIEERDDERRIARQRMSLSAADALNNVRAVSDLISPSTCRLAANQTRITYEIKAKIAA